MSTLLAQLHDLTKALASEPPDAMRTLRARAWAVKPPPASPLRTRVHPRTRTPVTRDAALERATTRLLASLARDDMIELRASAPTLARTLEALRAGPRREPWIRELLVHAAATLDRAELDRAAAILDREQNTSLGQLLALT